MIKIQNLHFFYDDFHALKAINLEIEKGSIVALVGPNGSGKTTLMRTILGLELPIYGELIVNGVNVIENARGAHQYIGYLSDSFGINPDLTVEQCLNYTANLQKVPRNEIRARVEEVLALIDLKEKRKAMSNGLSRGQKQRLALGQAIIHKPKLLILDEPASGLDPEQRRKMGELFVTLHQQGVTILVSSHILEELSLYSTHLLSIKEGKITQFQALNRDKDRLTYQIEIADGFEYRGKALIIIKDFFTQLDDQIGKESVDMKGNRLLFSLKEGDSERRVALIHDLVIGDIPLLEFSRVKSDISSLYFSVLDQEEGR